MDSLTKIDGYPILGYETHQRMRTYPNKHFMQSEIHPITCDVGLKVLAYVPVLNIIVGLGRLFFALYLVIRNKVNPPTEAEKSLKKRQINYFVVRGVLEICGFCVIPMALDFTKAAIQGIIIAQNKHQKLQ